MYSVIKGVVWVCYLHLTPFVIFWLIGALSTAVYYATLQCKKEAVLSLIPGLTTAMRIYTATDTWYYAVPGAIVFIACIISWNPILTILYVLYVMVVNSLYTKVMFARAVWLLSPLGWYKCLFEWKEAIKWLRLSRETSSTTKKSSTTIQKQAKTLK